ncbi:Syntaxin-like protein psy1 [Zancudomyces culisetae]|uniref:Syntaxin-like protein psy1 n=1 Tax=Zancudomyces culisetae TaxID=1213189 RepID=A0A1R1PK15_ZANCU|nr:Syntaxin-like protein psy1 [Zancudomyces culisetae]OMH81232.1 Syntaxin-like protein psy1 [Zancudomyces culisetae]|eukprot:OMH79474.1 Syntaxin-like protein psy1 [Zancudomyces culisetae]
MSRDRFAELKAARKESISTLRASDVSRTQTTGEKTEMEIFYTKVGEIEDMINKVNILVSQVQDFQEKNLTSIDIEKGKVIRAEVEQKVGETNREIQNVRKRLMEMENLNNQIKVDSGDEAVRRGRHAALVKKFTEAIEKYRSIERESQMKYRLRMERQIRIVNPNATEEEIRNALDSDNARAIFAQSVVSSERTKKAKNVLKEVEERNQDIKKIEKTIIELNQLFVEMQSMVNRQQAMLDNIEKAVESTQQYTVRANEEIDTAIEIRKSSRKVRDGFGFNFSDMHLLC